MKLENAIKKRRSIRSYLKKSVPKVVLFEILKLANLAPTASSHQNRFFVIIDNQDIKKKIYLASRKQPYILEAPIVICVLTNIKLYQATTFLKENDDWGMDFWGANVNNYLQISQFVNNWVKWQRIWAIQDADTATTTLLLAATAKGLASCWIGAFDHQEVIKILSIPENYEPTALITLGYQKEPPRPQTRKPIKTLLHWNKW